MGYFVQVETGVNVFVEDIQSECGEDNCIFTWMASEP